MIPTAIEADRAAGTLNITWDDGHTSLYPLPDLRWACPCAECKGEWGRPGRLSHVDTLAPDETQLHTMLPVGMYGITPVWISGHQSGIYSWEYLRSICPCGACGTSNQ